MDYVKPAVVPEAVVVFELCHTLRCSGIEFDQEYHVTLPLPKYIGRRGIRKQVRIDVVVLKDGKIVGAIEAKRKKPAGKLKKIEERDQVTAYRKALPGVPVYTVHGLDGVPYAVKFAASVAGVKLQQ